MPANQTYKRKSWNLYEGWKDVQCLIKKERVEEKKAPQRDGLLLKGIRLLAL